MLQLKSLNAQLEALQVVLDTAIRNDKNIEEIQESHSQVTKLKHLIYERKMYLIRQGSYKEDRNF